MSKSSESTILRKKIDNNDDEYDEELPNSPSNNSIDHESSGLEGYDDEDKQYEGLQTIDDEDNDMVCLHSIKIITFFSDFELLIVRI